MDDDGSNISFEEMVEFSIYEPLSLDTNHIVSSMLGSDDRGGDDDDQGVGELDVLC